MVLAVFVLASGDAYEIGTHALIAKTAHDRSTLSPTHATSIVPVLGFDRLNDTFPFSGFFQGVYSDEYLDNITPTDPLNPQQALLTHQRRPQSLDRDIFNGLLNRGFLVADSVANYENTVQGWLMRGAVREDDNDFGPLGSASRDLDPWGNLFRATGHFYDPINDAGYAYPVYCLVFTCVRSTEWALGRTNLLAGAGVLQPHRRNHFTWQDARNHYLWALTLTKAGSRNDAHAPPYLAPFSPADGPYEKYTETRVFGQESGESFALYDGNLPPIGLVPPIRLSGNQPYPIPRFRLPAYYFTTQVVDSGIASRRGLADYSNRGYFTAGTLPKTGQYVSPPRPSVSPSTYTSISVDTGVVYDGQIVPEQLYAVSVVDPVNPNYDSQSGLFAPFAGKIPLLRRGIAERAFELYAMPQLAPADMGFVIDENVMRYNADALIPRAIAYSAGMIDYFFRGRLEVSPIEQNVFAVLHHDVTHSVDADGYPRNMDNTIFGFEMVRLRVRNVSEPIVESGFGGAPFPQVAASGGTMVAVARYHRNACYKPDLTGERVI